MLLRVRITLLVVLIVVFIGASFSIANWTTINNNKERFDQSIMEGRAELWKQIINGQSSAMINGTSALIRDRNTRKALKKQDIAQLNENASTTFNLLNASGVLTRLQITDAQGRVLYSEPVSFSGKSKKTLIEKALKQGKVLSGIERDDDGKLLNIVAFPLSMRGKVIGAGVYAKDLSHAVKEFKQVNHSDVLISSPRNDSDYVTSKELFDHFANHLSQLPAESTTIMDREDKYFSVVHLPISDEAEVIAKFITAKDVTESYNQQQATLYVSTTISVVVLILSIVIVYMYMGFVLRPLGTAVENLREISEGNLSITIDVKSNDEIGAIQQGMQNTILKLRDIVSQIMSMTEQLGVASNNIGNSASQTRDGVHQEQAELSQLTTAITQMTATVQEVASNATVAASSTEQSDNEAREGQQLVQQTISSIQSLATEIDNASQVVNQLEGDSNAIGAILDVIKGIAEQTNLLALNAAIEAARAGEQGRGFAVVADEVRSLASRTQQSTQEIQEMIENLQRKSQDASVVMGTSQNKVKESVLLAAKSGDSLNTITEAVANISDMNIQIATAAEQQASVSEEINRNAVNINNISEVSAEGMDVIFKGTDELAEISRRLNDIVNTFKI